MGVSDSPVSFIMIVLPWDCHAIRRTITRRMSPGSLDADATAVSCMLVVYDHVGSRPVSPKRLV